MSINEQSTPHKRRWHTPPMPVTRAHTHKPHTLCCHPLHTHDWNHISCVNLRDVHVQHCCICRVSSPAWTELVRTNITKSSLREQNRSAAQYSHARQVEVIAVIDAIQVPRATTDPETNANQGSGGSNDFSPADEEELRDNSDADSKQAQKMKEKSGHGKKSLNDDRGDKKEVTAITRITRETNMVSGRWVAGECEAWCTSSTLWYFHGTL